MSDKLLHLVRHGEVHNPDRVLYGRLPGYRLSELGHRMAEAAALEIAGSDRVVAKLVASPLQRTQESARPVAAALGLEIVTDERIIEPTNRFEGLPNTGPEAAFKQARNWPKLWNPLRPSWGEPYRQIAGRVREAMDEHWDSVRDGDIVMVSHQAPIWIAHLDIAGRSLAHNPAKRRCALSSITTFERRGERWFEVDYREPAADLVEDSVDVGAV
ncbi:MULTISPECIES: histidine phosphatase family protein [Leucobacter]|uniref:Histidine phosphatase family protein n=1 Tax=Leucobacter iarius TaxID=333963 RepID=A0ABP4Y0B4_9MICO|nr:MULTISPECIES: histidine phosphatase family protein [unclassified Leucobacter]PIJ53923.1 histidine phosphatase family protein [Leucobacter sp. OLES1]KKI16330.1 phosphoglycerate mutase [Leucobacter sp. Ag1]PII84856.1 histidine phosphatase family protein [Leucobacter sp. OLCALW19]PII87714.1 histidine phosphatase family protein [Leucobacter sp. OLTLW20]PII93801.1 histidine phosphatase family protein [Leucobacter sp. OLAS13]